MLWENSVMDFAIDPHSLTLALSTAIESDIHGTFLVNWDGQATKISDDIFWNIEFIDSSTSPQFLGFNSNEVISFTPDGVIGFFDDRVIGNASTSPDGKWFVIYQESDNEYWPNGGMILYNSDGEYIRTLATEPAEPLWRPDSRGLFFLSDSLYYMSIPDGESILVEDCLPKGCTYWFDPGEFVWLP
jgi:hypothetical protein